MMFQQEKKNSGIGRGKNFVRLEVREEIFFRRGKGKELGADVEIR